MQHILATTPQQLLSVVPMLTGGVPTNSVVLVPLHGKRACAALRTDLPPEDNVAPWCEQLLLRLGPLGAARVVIVVYTDAIIGAGGLPYVEQVRTVTDALARSGYEVVDSFVLASDCWGDYRNATVARGPLDELSIDASLDAPSTYPELRAGADALPRRADAEVCARVRSAMAELDEATAVRDYAYPLSLMDALLHAEPPFDDALLARCISALQAPAARDEALVYLALRTPANTRSLQDDGDLLLGLRGNPLLGHLREAVRLLELLYGLCDDEHLPPIATMLAWLHWASGTSSAAAAAADEALRVRPGYSMAELIATVIDRVAMPAWLAEAYAQRAATLAD